MDCYIFTGGGEIQKEKLTFLPTDKDFVIAADSGALTLYDFSFKICPNVIMGDFDSSKIDTVKTMYPDARYIISPAEKDDTDTMLAIKYALKLKPEKIVIIGGLGKRADHELSNIFSLLYISKHSVKGYIDNGTNLIYLADKDGTYFSKASQKKKYISFIPLCDVSGLTISGFKYNLENASVSQSEIYTSSNQLSDENAKISFSSGTALIIESED